MCDVFEHLVEDDDYAAYAMMGGKGHVKICPKYYSCDIIMVPHVITTALGMGWIFPKRSPFLPIFHKHLTIIQETGVLHRIADTYDPLKGMPNQICKEYDGEPIGAEKCFSLFGMMLSGACFSIITFM